MARPPSDLKCDDRMLPAAGAEDGVAHATTLNPKQPRFVETVFRSEGPPFNSRAREGVVRDQIHFRGPKGRHHDASVPKIPLVISDSMFFKEI
jgi:hypothetical protein